MKIDLYLYIIINTYVLYGDLFGLKVDLNSLKTLIFNRHIDKVAHINTNVLYRWSKTYYEKNVHPKFFRNPFLGCSLHHALRSLFLIQPQFDLSFLLHAPNLIEKLKIRLLGKSEFVIFSSGQERKRLDY